MIVRKSRRQSIFNQINEEKENKNNLLKTDYKDLIEEEYQDIIKFKEALID